MNRRNSEGYPDPTPYRPLVYIASPFSGDTERNIVKTRGYCRLAVSKGCIPFAPHLHYPQFLDDGDKQERELGLEFALVLLGKCDELWVFGQYISSGMSREIVNAVKRNMMIKYFDDKGEEVLK